MFRIKVERDPDRRFGNGVRLQCPLGGGDVDIEWCYACGRLARLIEGDRPNVACTALRALREPKEFL